MILSGLVARDALRVAAIDGSTLVYEYLSSVVLNRLQDDLRRFALDASVLPVMSGDICDKVLQREDSVKMLRQLARKSVFMDVSEGVPETYAFHDLFRSFLGNTLANSDPVRQTRLRSRAASWLERDGAIDGAFRLLIEAGDLRKASDLAEQYSRRILDSGRLELLEGWWRALKGSGFRTPHLMLALGTGYMDRGSLEMAEQVCATATYHIGEGASPVVRARLDNLLAAILFGRGDYQACLERASRVARQPARQVPHETRSIALGTLALALATTRRNLPEARRAAQQAVDAVVASKDRHALPSALSALSYVLDAQGDYRAMSEVVERVVSLLEGVGSSRELASALNNLGVSRHKSGQFDSALTAFGEALKHARQAASPVQEATVLYGQADLFSDVGMAIQAAQLYGEGLAIAARLAIPRLIHYGCVQTSELYLRRNNLAVAKEWMKRALEYESQGRRAPSTAIQLAAIEERASPANAITSLRSLLANRKEGMSAEEEGHARLVMARGLFRTGKLPSARKTIEQAVMLAASSGAEQFVASEIASDSLLSSLLSELRRDGLAECEVLYARLSAISGFRHLHEPAPAVATAQRQLRVQAFGPGQIALSGKRLKGLRRQAREVLYFLSDRKVASREILAEAFWPGLPEGRRSASIHSAIHGIRRLIGKDSVLFEDGVYRIAEELELVYDVEQFERSAGIAERLPVGDPRRFFALTEAVGSYKGAFLEDVSSEWVSERRHELEVRYLDLAAELASEALIRDQPKAAVEHLRQVLVVDPLRDDLNIRYMEALGRLGQLTELAAHYNRYTQLLRQELGIDPPQQARDLYARLIG